ncbi:MAG: hypothetical protein ACJ74Y_01215 [Bryobacteraceae bacterium]
MAHFAIFAEDRFRGIAGFIHQSDLPRLHQFMVGGCDSDNNADILRGRLPERVADRLNGETALLSCVVDRRYWASGMFRRTR